VVGTVTVEGASVRTEGPKHDRGVVLTLVPLGGAPPVGPGRSGKATMDQRGLVFLPHVLAIAPGTTVTFLNSDNDQHNVYFLDDETGETLDIGTWGPGVSVDHRFDKPGMVITLCKLHLEMAAYIVVTESPYFQTVELDGSTRTASFRIEGVPPGSYHLIAWHKKLRQKGGPIPVRVEAGGEHEVPVIITRPRLAGG